MIVDRTYVDNTAFNVGCTTHSALSVSRVSSQLGSLTRGGAVTSLCPCSGDNRRAGGWQVACSGHIPPETLLPWPLVTRVIVAS